MPKTFSNKVKAKFTKWAEPVSASPGDTDVLLGRGNGTAHFAGNINFRRVVWAHRENYRKSYRNEKAVVAQQVIDCIAKQNPPGRFLEKGPDNRYYLVPQDRAIEKTCQALREKKNRSPIAGTLPKVPLLTTKTTLIIHSKKKRSKKLRRKGSSQPNDTSSLVVTDEEQVNSSEWKAVAPMDSLQITGLSYNLLSTMKKVTPLSNKKSSMSEDEEEPLEEAVVRDNKQNKSLLEIEIEAKQLRDDESNLDRVANYSNEEPTTLPPSLISRQSSSFSSLVNGADKLDEIFTDLPPHLTTFCRGIYPDTLKTRRHSAFDESKEPMKQDMNRTSLLQQDDDDDAAASFLGNIGLCDDGIEMISSFTDQQESSEAVGAESMPSSRCHPLNSPATVIGIGSIDCCCSFQEEIPKTILKPTHSLFSDDIEDYHDAPMPNPGNADGGYQKSFHLLDGCLDTF